MKTLVTVLVACCLPFAARAAAPTAPAPSARRVIDDASAKVKGIAGQRWVSRGMKRALGNATDAINAYEQIGGGRALAGEGTVTRAPDGTIARIPVGDRVHLTGSSLVSRVRGVSEVHSIGAAYDLAMLEASVLAIDHRGDREWTREVDASVTIPPRQPKNARERRLADRHGLFWPGERSAWQSIHEPAPGHGGPGRLARGQTAQWTEHVVDRGGAATAFDLTEGDAQASMTAQLARAHEARNGKLGPTQRRAMTRALREIDALVARGDYRLDHHVESELNRVIATFPGGQRLTLTTMELAGQRATIELKDGALRLELAHGAGSLVQVSRHRAKKFAGGMGEVTRSVATHRVDERAHLWRSLMVSRPMSPAEAVRLARE